MNFIIYILKNILSDNLLLHLHSQQHLPMAMSTKHSIDARVPSPIRNPEKSKIESKKNLDMGRLTEIMLDINYRSKVTRSDNLVKKVFFKSFDDTTSHYHFNNEVKMLTHFHNKGVDICPRMHCTEYFKDSYNITMDYSGVDLCQLYDYCMSNTTYVEPFTRFVHRFDPEWWFANITDICKQIKQIMQVMRKENVVHLDIKAENFVFDLQTHKVRIIDFSNSYFTTDPAVKPEYLRMYSIGTTSYMSPEAVLEGDRSYAVDLWAAATTLYVLQKGVHVPGSSLILRDMIFDMSGTVTDKPRFRAAFATILMHAKTIIEKDDAHDENIRSLAPYFTKKSERPTEFLAP